MIPWSWTRSPRSLGCLFFSPRKNQPNLLRINFWCVSSTVPDFETHPRIYTAFLNTNTWKIIPFSCSNKLTAKSPFWRTFSFHMSIKKKTSSFKKNGSVEQATHFACRTNPSLVGHWSHRWILQPSVPELSLPTIELQDHDWAPR